MVRGECLVSFWTSSFGVKLSCVLFSSFLNSCASVARTNKCVSFTTSLLWSCSHAMHHHDVCGLGAPCVDPSISNPFSRSWLMRFFFLSTLLQERRLKDLVQRNWNSLAFPRSCTLRNLRVMKVTGVDDNRFMKSKGFVKWSQFIVL